MAKTYTTVPDLASGATVTETNWDTHLRDNINNLIVPPMCHAYSSASQSITTATVTAINLNSERYDTDSMHDTVTNNTRITANTAGVYIITGIVRFAPNATGVRLVRLRVNGATYIASDERSAVSGDATDVNLSTAYQFAATDYVELIAYQTSGSSIDSDVQGNWAPSLTMTWVGRTS